MNACFSSVILQFFYQRWERCWMRMTDRERERKRAQVSFLVHSARKSAPFTAFNVLTFPYTSSTIPFSWRAEQVSGAHTQRSLFFLLLIYILIKSKMTHQWSFSPPPGSSSLQCPWSLGLALQRAQLQLVLSRGHACVQSSELCVSYCLWNGLILCHFL